MNRQPVVEGKARVPVVEVGSYCVPLKLTSERREGIFEVLQEPEHLFSREHVFHHHEPHEVQAEVTRDRGWFYGCAKPAHVGGPARLGWLIHAALPG
jgi:hypothetical protein